MIDTQHHGPHRREHPPCAGCRHEMTWGIVQKGDKREATHGQCVRDRRGEWPHGCRHYVERGDGR